MKVPEYTDPHKETFLIRNLSSPSIFPFLPCAVYALFSTSRFVPHAVRSVSLLNHLEMFVWNALLTPFSFCVPWGWEGHVRKMCMNKSATTSSDCGVT